MSENNTEEAPQSFWQKYWPLFALLTLVLAAWSTFAAYYYSTDAATLQNTGTFGDTFGMLNTLFSGLAFAAFIYTIFLQHKELGYQRQELKDTRSELRGQKVQLEAQNQTFSRQRFESTFFQMLDLHHKIVEAITMNSARDNQVRSGREALKDFGDYLIRETNMEAGPRSTLNGALELYLDNFQDRQHALSHYFRNLYRIFKLINDSDAVDKLVYSGIARAQLSSSELVLLFFNCLSCHGKDQFKPLAESFALFEHLPKEDRYVQRFGGEYDSKAFGTNATES